MVRKVTIRGLNREYARALFSSRAFWVGVIIYIVGLICLFFSLILGGVIMFVAGIIMLNADWNGRKKVVRNLQWKK